MANGIAIGLSLLAGVWIGWLAVPMVVGAISILMLLKRKWQLTLIASCLVAVVIGAVRSVEVSIPEVDPWLSASTSATGRVVSFPRPSGASERVILQVGEICNADQCVPASARVMVYVPQTTQDLARGSEVRVEWVFTPAAELESGYRGHVLSHQAVGNARATTAVTVTSAPWPFRWLADASGTTDRVLHEVLPGDAGALASGIVTGNDSALSDQAESDFLRTGTSHITSVSGQNIALVVGFLSLWYVPASPRGRVAFHVVLIITVWMYAAFVGFEPPAQRAAITATLMILGRHVGRRPDPVTILCLTLGVMALAQPMVVHSLGYWLSAVSSLSLCVMLPRTWDGSFGDMVWSLARVPIVASFATMPLTLAAFGTWSPVGLVANIILGTVITLTFPVVYLFAIVALISPVFAGHIAVVPRLLLDLNLWVVHEFASIGNTIRIDHPGPVAMVALSLAVVWCIWLTSGESERWLRRCESLWREWRSSRLTGA